MPWLCIPPRGKLEKKAVCPPRCGDGATAIAEPFKNKTSIAYCDGIFVFISCSPFGMLPDRASRGGI